MSKEKIFLSVDLAYKQANQLFILLAAVTMFVAIFSTSIHIQNVLVMRDSDMIMYFVIVSKTVLAITMLAIFVHVCSWGIMFSALITPKDINGKQNKLLFCTCSFLVILLALAVAYFVVVVLTTIDVLKLPCG